MNAKKGGFKNWKDLGFYVQWSLLNEVSPRFIFLVAIFEEKIPRESIIGLTLVTSPPRMAGLAEGAFRKYVCGLQCHRGVENHRRRHRFAPQVLLYERARGQGFRIDHLPLEFPPLLRELEFIQNSS